MNEPIKYDWQLLHDEWLKSKMKKNDFLSSKGISPHGLIAKRKTHDWDIDLKSAAKNLKAEYNSDEVGEAIQSLDKEPELDPEETISETQRAKASDLAHQIRELNEEDVKRVVRPDIAIREIWQIVAQWRQKQAENDYKLADVIRLHCKVMLKNKLKSKVDRNGQQTFTSEFAPKDLLSIARIAETVQKIQRLALGLSTENIGIESSNAKETTENEIPVFEVQINQNGKFVRARN